MWNVVKLVFWTLRGDYSKMKEGTKSVLFGCHNPLMHGIWVLMAWRLEYRSWPQWWEVIGIFLHDVGVWGRQYLSDDEAKIGHWQLGAGVSSYLVYVLSGDVALAYSTEIFIAGHCPEESHRPESKLARADKRSWLIAPSWWLWCNYFVEWHNSGHRVTPPPVWRKLVAENLKKERPIGNHELYIKNRKERS